MNERSHSQSELATRRAINRRIARLGEALVAVLVVLLVVLLFATTVGHDNKASAATKKPIRYSWANASCYGPGLYGNHTANGTVLTPRTLGVAHKTLPFGTRVLLKSHGRRVIVKVIDRGPFVAGRTFDLTHATVRRLGYRDCYSWGHRNVQYQILRTRKAS